MTPDEAYLRATDTVCELLAEMPDRQGRIRLLHLLSRDMGAAVRNLLNAQLDMARFDAPDPEPEPDPAEGAVLR